MTYKQKKLAHCTGHPRFEWLWPEVACCKPGGLRKNNTVNPA